MAQNVKHIMMVGDDGSVYQVDPADIARVAHRVPNSELSADVQAHVKAATPKAPGSANFFTTRADFFAATKGDIQAPENNDVLSANSANFFAANSYFFAPGSGPGGKKGS
jgi:hypothetical protein